MELLTSTEAIPDAGKYIQFQPDSMDFDCYFNGGFLGCRRTQREAEELIDEYVHQGLRRGTLDTTAGETVPMVQVDDEVPAPVAMAVVFEALVAAYDDAAEKTVADAKWHNAVTSAFDHLLPLDALDYHDGVLQVQSASSDDVYAASPTSCQCHAFTRGNPCWHRAAARLVQLAVDGK
jgi:hypothetical protein